MGQWWHGQLRQTSALACRLTLQPASSVEHRLKSQHLESTPFLQPILVEQARQRLKSPFLTKSQWLHMCLRMKFCSWTRVSWTWHLNPQVEQSRYGQSILNHPLVCSLMHRQVYSAVRLRSPWFELSTTLPQQTMWEAWPFPLTSPLRIWITTSRLVRSICSRMRKCWA